jgi:hypothetical protein
MKLLPFAVLVALGSTSLPAQSPPHGMQLLIGDDCANPFVIAGLGTFNYDCQLATTGTEGQNEALCISPGITTDVWYRWTAPASGNATMTLCGSGTLMDSKIAAYAGSVCPVDGTALACNDDYCSTESRILFPVSAGSVYMLQLGSYPGAGFGWYGVFTLSIAPGAPNDECASAAPIAGTGSFAFDNTAASTSTQQGLACGFGYCNNDVWFDWTASATGTCDWSLCGTAGFDTLIAAYAGSGCPAPGTALGCNDDSCGGSTQSSLSFPCVAGQHYLLQLGAYAVGAGSGTFSLDIVSPPANDSCSTPQALGASTGTFPFTLVGASTGAQGQSESACSYLGQTGIESDVWFTWIAPGSARARLSLCTGASFDTKVAVYNGSGCPAAGAAITCNDDACATASEICFDVTAGHTYLIQLGTSPGAAPGAGTFDLSLQPMLPPCTYDDGSSEGMIGLGGGGDMVWLQRFGSAGTSSIVDSIEVAWGSPVFAGASPGNGTPSDVFLWQDGPTQDGDPSDAILLFSSATSVANVDTDTFVSIAFAPIAIQGIFFVGSHLPSSPGQPVAPMDQNCPSARVAWFFGAGVGQQVDYAHPGSNPVLPQSFDDAGFPANLMLRAGCTLDPAQYVCVPGSTGVLACPCANPPAGAARGCNNKGATGGASISGSGSNQLSTPTLVFSTAGENATVGSVLIQGTLLNAGVPFGHGVRCAAGTIKRLYVKLAVGGSITAPQFPADTDIPARSAALGNPIGVGEQRIYQVYYRDTTLLLPGCPLPANQFNVTNAALVTWLP